MSAKSTSTISYEGEFAKTEAASTQAIPVEAPKKSLRGFASMDKEKQREIARKGGRIAHLKGRAHEFTSEEARSAGRKGGVIVSQDRDHMARIGREGGQARGLRVVKSMTTQEEHPKTEPTPTSSH